MTLGERIQDLRKKKGYSQEKLADHLNMSRQAVAKWEQDICEPNINCLISMSELFEVDLDYLIAGKIKEKTGEKIIVKEKEHLLDKIDIILLLVLIISIIFFFGLFIYAVLNPMYYHQAYSFIWWYIYFWVSSGTLFRFMVLISVFGIVFSLYKFLKRRK